MKTNKKWKLPKISISKRQIFVLVTAFLTSGLIVTQVLESESRFLVVGILAIAAYFLTAFALREDLSGIEWITLLVLPAMYTLAVGLFYFLLPVRWITRLPVATLYAIGMYALLLTENIYNVAAIRTIQLLRAAHAVGFLITLVTAFLLFQSLFSFHLAYWGIFFGVFIISLPLVFQALWAVKLEEGITEPVAIYSFSIALILSEIALMLSFWPLNISLYTLFLIGMFYALLGVGQQYLTGRLFKKTILEFFVVPVIVFLILLISTKWGT
ncbi:hypothetical protein HY439_01375 [Candidatus Microgenomates bacterium]|nr:hypothetical protein [Candidatus Microgenomates bacterium]